MDKASLISLIRNQLTGGDTSSAYKSKYHPKVVEKAIHAAYDNVLQNTIDSALKQNRVADVENIVKSYVYDVNFDEQRNQHYVSVPDIFSSDMIRMVSAPKNRVQAFAIIGNSSESIFNELDVVGIDSTPGAMIENGAIYFDDLFPIGCKQVMVKMVPSFSVLREDDDIGLPFEPIIDYVIKFFGQQRSDDQINDNNMQQLRQ